MWKWRNCANLVQLDAFPVLVVPQTRRSCAPAAPPTSFRGKRATLPNAPAPMEGFIADSNNGIEPIYSPTRNRQLKAGGVDCCGVVYPSTAIAFFVFNTIWLIFGIALCVLSGWAYERHDAIAKEVPEAGIGPVLSAGVILILVSILGYIGQRYFASSSGRWILGAYTALLSLVIVLEIVSASLMFVIIGRLNGYD